MNKSALVLAAVGVIGAGAAIATFAGASARADGKPPATQTQPERLVAGSKAPAFAPATWVKGDPVKSFEPGKVYVVEFWATWCPPCRDSIPHLTAMQKKFKGDATIIGMASFERPSSRSKDDRLAKVEKFVKEWGDKMNYSVAFETDNTIGAAWMEAAEQDGIPAAFIVGGDGKIAWIGSPLDKRMESKVEAAIKAAKASSKQGENPADSEKR